MESYYSSTTTLAAEEEAVVVARSQGIIEAIFVEEGDRVKAGQALAQIETERLKLEELRTRTQLQSLKRAYERAEQLHERRMVSNDEFDRARFDYEREEANLALQEYALREATIRAPIDGVITRRQIKVGYTLNQNAPAFEMKQTTNIEATLNIPEREIGRIATGQLVRVRVDSLPKDEFTGVIERVAPEVDATSGTFRATVALANQAGTLKPGMFARVDVLVDKRDNVALVAQEAVVVQRNRSHVFVVRDDKAVQQSVVTGYSSAGNVEIREGLREGDEVILTGRSGLRDGAPVRVVGY